MIIKSNIFLQPRTSHYMEHELACLLCREAASKITLHAQFSLPLPICLNEPVQAVSHGERGALMTVNPRQSGGEDGGEWIGRRRGETERGLWRWRKVRHRLHWQWLQLQAEKERMRGGRILLLTAGVHKNVTYKRWYFISFNTEV